MNVVKKMTFVLMLALLFSSENVSAGNNSGEVSVRYFKIDGNYLTIYADTGYTFVDKSACQDGTTFAEAVVIESNRDDFRELYVAVMLGFANSMKLTFWLDGSCSRDTQGGPYPIATLVYVVKSNSVQSEPGF